MNISGIAGKIPYSYSNSFSNSKTNNASQSGAAQNTASMREFESQQRAQEKRASIVEQSQSYADSLRASRTKAKDVSLEKKKLQYNYKRISSQILRSKNSVSARKAVAAARREVQRLKRLKNSGEYDEDELQISIDHAKAMERVAKKKVAHLQQEEMIERGQNGALSGINERDDKGEDESAEDKSADDEELKEALSDEAMTEEELISPEQMTAQLEAYQEGMQMKMEELQDEMLYRMDELQAEMEARTEEIRQSAAESMNDLMGEISEEMTDMLEDLDLNELSETMFAPDPNMSADDLKMLKMKHRTKEMKDIAKADGDYLKAIFDKYEKSGMSGAVPSAGGSGVSFGGFTGVSVSPAPMPEISIPAAYSGGGVDVSV